MQTKGNYNLIARLPRQRVFIYVVVDEGRGQVLALQDPTRANGYEAVISVRDGKAGRGKYRFRAFYSRTRPEVPPLAELIRIPNAPKPHYTLKGQFLGPTLPERLGRAHYCQDSRLWAEKDGPVRSLIDAAAEPAFCWQGQVDEYVVLAFDGKNVSLFDCGLADSRTITQQVTNRQQSIEDHYLILSRCSGPGRVRVTQQMNAKNLRHVLIEINDRDVPNASRYSLTAHLVPKRKVEEFYRPRNDFAERHIQAKEAEASGDKSTAASHWAWIATHTNKEQTRLWAIEKFCMLQPYPGPDSNPHETEMLNILQNQALAKDPELRKSTPVPPEDELLEVLRGKNIILAWPKEYTARVPTKWRFLAELDACMEWLKDWTGSDQVRHRKKRMISRFRVDEGGVALYVSFRLHIPRQEMRIPPDHGPYSHEVSHGFVYFPAISPTGHFNEGLAEVARTSYYHFLGLNDSSIAFRQKCLTGLVQHMYSGGTVLDAPGYAGAASLYFVIMDHFCRDPNGNDDWHQFTKLLDLARDVKIDKDANEQERWRLVARLCEKAFGREALSVLEGLGLCVPTKQTESRTRQ